MVTFCVIQANAGNGRSAVILSLTQRKTDEQGRHIAVGASIAAPSGFP
jgi:hypothetical protein